MQSYLLVLFFLSAVFAVYPLTFPTTPVGTTILTGSTPMGMTYWAGNGGGYFISTVGSSSISWLSTTGSWSPNVFSDSDLLKAAFTGYGVTVSDYYTDDMLLVARTNATGGIPQAALTAFSLGATTWGNKLWTLDLGNGFAKDVAVSESGYAYVTDAKMGQIWEVSLSLTAPTFTMLTNDTVFAASNPTSQFSLGVSGVRVVPGGGYIVAGIIEPGISRTRLYCVNIGSSNYGTVTPITFTNAAAYPLMDTTPVDGLDFYPVPSSATTSALGFGAAPAVSGIITPVGGDFCATGTTYMISKLANNTATITAMNTYTATVWNCDFQVMVSLGSSLAAVTGGVNPPSYAVWVNNGTLPYEPLTNFAPGWDCSTAIPIVPNAVSMFYDMYCFRGSRVTIPSSSSCGTGFGIWFKVNVTGMTGGLTFSTRTVKTQFDNYITLYSGCPTYCDTVPSSPKIACSDDNSLPGECSASSSSYCAAYDVPDVSLYKEVYAVINFYSAPTIGACVAGTNFFTTFAAVTSGTAPVAPVAPFPPRVCDPCVPTPTPAPTPTPTPAPAPGDSSSACATAVF